MISEQKLKDKVQRIIADQLAVSMDEAKSAQTFTQLGADHVEKIAIIMDVEDAFNIEIPNDETENINTFEDVVEYLKNHAKATLQMPIEDVI